MRRLRNALHGIIGLAIIAVPLAGIGLIVWAVVGQCMAQVSLDGQVIQWRIVPDISLIGWSGLLVTPLGGYLCWYWFVYR